jgi:REP-associated tyrosine transposase
MARRPRHFRPGLLHHVVARGNRREVVFLRPQDFHAYLARLRRYRSRRDMEVLAYCLMPNHVHLLIRQGPASLDKFMQSLQQSYTQYFNRTYETVGHVFQGRYKALLCESDDYLATLVRYIHLNPVRAGIVTDPETYPFSSHAAYLRGRKTRLVDPEPVLQILGGKTAYCRLIGETDGASHGMPERERAGAAVETAERRSPCTPPATSATVVVDELARCLRVDSARLRSTDGRREICRARSLVAYTLVRRLGYSVTSTAHALARQPTGVSMMLARLSQRQEDTRLL